MRKTKSRSKLSEALREMRSRAGLSQEGLARELFVSLQTVTLWETKRVPTGITLARLSDLAEYYGYKDVQQVFEAELDQLPPAVAADIKRERKRWEEIYGALDDIQREFEENCAGLISGKCDDLWNMLRSAQAWAWRNQR